METTIVVPTPEQAEEALHLAPLPEGSPWWARWLVDNWKSAYKWASTWFLALLAAVPLIQEALPSLQLEHRWDHALTTLLAILAIVARVTRQSAPSKE